MANASPSSSSRPGGGTGSSSGAGVKPPTAATKPAPGSGAKPVTAMPANKSTKPTTSKKSAVAAKAATKSNQYAFKSGASISTSQPAGAPVFVCHQARKFVSVCDLRAAKISDDTSKRAVTVKAGAKPAFSAKLPPKKKALAEQYDLVLETVSAIIIEGKPPPGAKFAQIVPTAEYDGGCSDHAPTSVAYSPRNPDASDPILSPEVFHGLSFNGTVPAKMWITDKRNIGANDFAAFFTRNEDQVKEIELTFLSCGTPKAAAAKVGEFRGLVRVYRNETIDFALSFPPLYDKTYSRKKTKTETTETRTNAGASNYADTVKRDATGKVTGESTERKSGWIQQTTEEYEYDRTTGAVTAKEPEKKLKIGLSIKRNGDELNAGRAVNQWIEGYFSFSKLLFAALTDFQKMVPKVGFTLSCDIALLEGEISGSLGVRPQPAWDIESHKWVSDYGSIGFDLKLLGIALKVGFGVEASSPALLDWLTRNGEKAFELIVAIKAELGLEMHLKGEKTIFGPDEDKSGEYVVVSAPGQAKLEVYVQAKVTLAGVTCDAKAGVETGIEAGAEILMNPFNLRATCKLKAGLVYAYFNYPGKSKPSPRWEYKIWNEGKEHEYRALGVAAAT